MRSLAVFCGVALLSACSGSESKDGTTVPGTDDGPVDIETAETGTTNSFIDMDAFFVIGAFAFDDTTLEVKGFSDDTYGEQPITITVALLDSSVLEVGPTAANTCQVSITHPGPLPVADWAEEQGAWVAFEMPADAEVFSNCAGFTFPGEWGGDPAVHVAAWTWGAGINSLDPETEAVLPQQFGPSEWAAREPYVVGGGVLVQATAGLNFGDTSGTTPATPTGTTGATGDTGPEPDGPPADIGYQPDGAGQGSAVDENFHVETDAVGNESPIPKEGVRSADGVVTGMYTVTGNVYQPATLLLSQ